MVKTYSEDDIDKVLKYFNDFETKNAYYSRHHNVLKVELNKIW